jgi:tRNA (guanine-N7-)-methyltransferase
MRKKKNLDERLFACSDLSVYKLFHSGELPEKNLLDLSLVFGNENPVRLEIGCGKGKFINETAKLHPNVNFLALEKKGNVAVSAQERTKLENIPNIRYFIGMAEYLELVLPKSSIERIFLNFSCPFPKERHEKRRLSHKFHLDIFKRLLVQGGAIFFKTDNADFFEFSARSFTESGFELKNLTRDLHNSAVTGNIKTEYEDYFVAKGCKINYLEAFLK